MFPYQQIYCTNCANVMYITASEPAGTGDPPPHDTASQPTLPLLADAGGDGSLDYPEPPAVFLDRSNIESCQNNALISLDPALTPFWEVPSYLHGLDISGLPPDTRYILYLRFGCQLYWHEVADEYGKSRNCTPPSPATIQMRLRRLRRKCPAVNELYDKHTPPKAARTSRQVWV
jgi:hypothetical protein